MPQSYRSARSLRWTVALTALLAIASSEVRADGGSAALYVYLPVDVSPRVLEKGLGGGLPGVTVTVFGRYKDFEKAIERDHPDAVLTLRPVLEARKMKPALQASAGGKISETYVAMAASEVSAMAGKTLGAVDLMGRKETTSFFAQLLALSDPKITCVTKTEDLLPLLQFQTADIVLLPKRSATALKGKTTLSLKTTGLPSIEVGLPAVAVTGAGGNAITAGVRKLSRDVNLIIGVEQWQAE